MKNHFINIIFFFKATDHNLYILSHISVTCLHTSISLSFFNANILYNIRKNYSRKELCK